jgi:hypothetical protein
MFGERRYTFASMILFLAIAACNDLRDFRGPWQGGLSSNLPILRQGVASDATALLDVIELDRYGLRGRLTVTGVLQSDISSVPGAEADVLSTMTFDNAPLRVYLCFAPMASGEQAVVLVSLHQDHRIEVRIIRGGSPSTSIYAVFGLRAAS